MVEYYIRYEVMGGEYYYMIYRRVLCFHSFIERWNTSESAVIRLLELK